jgi:hypothetical protein
MKANSVLPDEATAEAIIKNDPLHEENAMHLYKEGKIKEQAAVKKWLAEIIEAYLNCNAFSMSDITTKNYEEYKSDAMTADSEGGLTADEFHRKWKIKFDPKYAGIGNGFLIGAQDWGTVKVISCEPLAGKMNEGLIFSVVIRDRENKINYKRDITVIPAMEAYLIADVKEYD